jgi:hypothetical protein
MRTLLTMVTLLATIVGVAVHSPVTEPGAGRAQFDRRQSPLAFSLGH